MAMILPRVCTFLNHGIHILIMVRAWADLPAGKGKDRAREDGSGNPDVDDTTNAPKPEDMLVMLREAFGEIIGKVCDYHNPCVFVQVLTTSFR